MAGRAEKEQEAQADWDALGTETCEMPATINAMPDGQPEGVWRGGRRGLISRLRPGGQATNYLRKDGHNALSLVCTETLKLRTWEMAKTGLPSITRRLIRKPGEKTAKKGGDSGLSDKAEKDGKEREENGVPLTKVLRTMGTGGVGFPSHLTTWLPVYLPVSFFRGLVRSTGGGKQAEKKRLLIF